MEAVTANIIRRRRVGPFTVRTGKYKFISVTYSTETLAPEIIRIAEHLFTEELLLQEITKRVRERTKHPDAEVVLEGIK